MNLLIIIFLLFMAVSVTVIIFSLWEINENLCIMNNNMIDEELDYETLEDYNDRFNNEVDKISQ